MSSSKEIELNSKDEQDLSSGEIDIRNILSILTRYRKLVGVCTFTGIFLSGIIAFTTKKVWQGEFQIVIQKQETIPSFSASGAVDGISKLSGLGLNKDPLRTEVGVLQSPSILMDIFEFVKKEKIKKGINVQEMKFSEWTEAALEVELVKRTSILNLAYRDHDKDLIINVLNRISNKYQEYSGSKRERGLQLGLDYFEKQIEKYKKQSLESVLKAQRFAMNNNINLATSQINSSIENNPSLFIPFALDVEQVKMEAKNKIQILDELIEKTKEMKNDSDEILYIASSINELARSRMAIELREIESKLASLRLVYKEEDIFIKDLKKRKSTLIELLKDEVIGIYSIQKANAEARLNASMRPQDVILKYSQLLNIAAKEEKTLTTLEAQYRVLTLEKARVKDPWELITKPTILPNAVAPLKKRIVGIGLLLGFVLGSSLAIYYDKKEDIIFSKKELISLINLPFIGEISTNSEMYFKESLDLLMQGKLLNYNGTISFLIVGEINDFIINQFREYLNPYLDKYQIIITNDFQDANKSKEVIILTALGFTTREDLINLEKKILLQQREILGQLVLT